MEGTVSVSTVMFRDAASALALLEASMEFEGFEGRLPGRWTTEAERCSCMLPWLSFLMVDSLPLSLCLLLLELLRSSVTFDDVTSLRSSSASLWLWTMEARLSS